MLELKLTESGRSYWYNSAEYQQQYEKLYDKLVPLKGSGKTLNAELLRGASRLTYEYFNNGNCNAYSDEDGVSEFYNKFLTLIENNVDDISDEVSNIRASISTDCDCFIDTSTELTAYTHMMDKVIFHILTHEDKEISANYKLD